MAAAGTLAAAGLSGPAGAAGRATSVASRAARDVDPAVARQLEKALRTALRDPSVHAPGGILHVRSPTLGRWTGVAGLGRVAPKVPMRARDRFRAGSIMKPFVSVVVLQLVERGRLSLDARLPEVLPADVVGRFPTAPDITVQMLLSHRSGIPEWDLPVQDEYAARHPAHVWTIAEILDLAAAKPPVFAPGAAHTGKTDDDPPARSAPIGRFESSPEAWATPVQTVSTAATAATANDSGGIVCRRPLAAGLGLPDVLCSTPSWPPDPNLLPGRVGRGGPVVQLSATNRVPRSRR